MPPHNPDGSVACSGRVGNAGSGRRNRVAADVILDSLSAALGGVGAGIGEFKKMIEWLLAEAGKRCWPV